MKPVDKFGNQIYPKTFSKIRAYGRILTQKGYIEAKNKPNLFRKAITEGCFFANMQGTPEVPIWEDTRPLFHWRFSRSVPKWLRRRLIKNELINLHKSGCPCRLSFHFHHSVEFENTGAQIDEDAGVFEWDDGYCEICGKDFQDEGSYCSEKCHAKSIIKYAPQCEACDKYMIDKGDWEMVSKYYDNSLIVHPGVEHHIDYSQDEKVTVCYSCHSKIHKTHYRLDLKPSDKRQAGNKLLPKYCIECNNVFQPRHKNQMRCKKCLNKQKPTKSHRDYRDWVIETYG